MGVNLKVVGKEATKDRQTLAPGLVSRSDGENLKYIEDKIFDAELIGRLLQESQAVNHWSNFGPVSQRLEREIAQALKLRDGLKVVMCSSGTAALHGIISLHETLAGKDMRWVTSSFGYYCTIQGPLRNATIADCDDTAMLDLKKLDPTSFDGMIVTNIFGQAESIDEYYRYAATHGKILCVDAAMAFGSHEHGANECISFHHTKPWGFGEGGCAIVAQEHEELFRSLICFGHQEGQAINRRATNGKVSDISCAYAYSRLMQMEQLTQEYKRQYHRIAVLGRQVGLGIVGDQCTHPGTPASVPFLTPLPLENFKHPVLPTGRYYHPLDESPVAHDIYKRIVNVACHPGMASIPDDQIKHALETFIARCL